LPAFFLDSSSASGSVRSEHRLCPGVKGPLE
jgi:hypothetical protein